MYVVLGSGGHQVGSLSWFRRLFCLDIDKNIWEKAVWLVYVMRLPRSGAGLLSQCKMYVGSIDLKWKQIAHESYLKMM